MGCPNLDSRYPRCSGHRAVTGEPELGISCHHYSRAGRRYWELQVGGWASHAGHWNILHWELGRVNWEPGAPYWKLGSVPMGS